MLKLNSLQSTNRKHSRRVGRGNGSGRGTFAGRGIKGQRARSGSRYGLKLRGLRTLFKAIPKVRGFRSMHEDTKLKTIGLAELEKCCEPNATVELRGYKVLASGTIAKPLTVKASAFSAAAQQKIEAAGGKAIPCGQ